MQKDTSMILVRHAPSVPAGFLYGRTNPDADTAQVCNAKDLLETIKDFGCDMVISSPARRCQQTAERLMQEADISAPLSTDERLWEQGFGTWDGMAFHEIPDIGERTAHELVMYKAHGGESFSDVCHRAWSCLHHISDTHNDKKILIVAHAGILRAASVFHSGRSMTEALMANPKPLGFVYL